MKPTVYIADLRHNFAGALSTDCMPLGCAYIKAVLEQQVPEVESKLFVYPQSLLEAIINRPPDVLMCSNYIWNEQLSLHVMDVAKRAFPNVLTVMGGPNIHLEAQRQIDWLVAHPQADVYALGEGELLGAELTRIFLNAGLSLDRFRAAEIPSSLVRRSDGSVTRSTPWNRTADLNSVPSPWLTGIQDEFFDGKLAPMVETNRGCPFQCTFCVQGVNWYTKVHYFDLDRLKEELTYIARKIQERSPSMTMLRIADSNYGMFERDIEISAHIGKLQKDYDWPKFIDVTTGKNRPERVIRSLEEASGAPVLYMAVQSLDDGVLRNVKRQNIKLEAYSQLQSYMRGRGLRTNSDLILGLPGESLASHREALTKLLDQKIDQMHNLQLLMLKGSEIETEESRRMFRLEPRYRLGPKNYGEYGDEKVFDYEEIIVSTDTLTFEDYLTARKYHLMASIFWNDGWFEDAFLLLDRLGIARSEVFYRFLPAMQRNGSTPGELLESFVRETIGELFPTPSALLEFYSTDEGFERLKRGDVGENLMYKYRALASFHHWPEICTLGMEVFASVIKDMHPLGSQPGFDQFWEDFRAFVEKKHAHGRDMGELTRPVVLTLSYDVAAWIAAGYPSGFETYRFPKPTQWRFSLSEVGEAGLRAAFAVWSERIQGLAKLVTRIQLAWQIREGELISDGGVTSLETERAVA